MKKIIAGFTALMGVILVLGCASKPAAPAVEVDPNLPVWLNEMPPEDALWGIGSAKNSSRNASMQMAEDRARMSISRQISVIAKGMIIDYFQDAGTNDNQASLELSRSVSQTLTNSRLEGARVIDRRQVPDGTWWYLVEYKKDDAKRVIASTVQAVDNDAARYADFKSQEALKMMDDAFDKQKAAKPEVVSN